VAHFMSPQPAAEQLPTLFNVDGVVGAPPAANQREDVLLVQFAFKMIADAPMSGSDPALVAAAKLVQVTGNIDTNTIIAIQRFQESRKKKNPNQIVDGRVSPAKGGYSYGPAMWTIAHLNDSMQQRAMDHWPRIDKLSSCPSELKIMVKRAVVGT
jgi:hypothetical protein